MELELALDGDEDDDACVLVVAVALCAAVVDPVELTTELDAPPLPFPNWKSG